MATPPQTTFVIHALTTNYDSVMHNNHPQEVGWSKLSRGCYKVNTDASFHEDDTGAMGDVLGTVWEKLL